MSYVVNLSAHRDELIEAEINARMRFVADALHQIVTLDDNPVQSALCLYVAAARVLVVNGVSLEMLQTELAHHAAEALAGRR